VAGDDPEYIRWLRLRMCACATWCGRRACDPHHARRDQYGPVGVGQRAPDRRAIAICRPCHDDYHEGRGYFVAMTVDDRRAWMDLQIALSVAAYERSLLPPGPEEIPF
jgi:hypothetical protein